MTKPSANMPLDFVQQLGHALLQFSAQLMRWLPEASLPRILLLCVALALISEALPLAATLFVLFVITKYVILAVAQVWANRSAAE